MSSLMIEALDLVLQDSCERVYFKVTVCIHNKIIIYIV